MIFANGLCDLLPQKKDVHSPKVTIVGAFFQGFKMSRMGLWSFIWKIALSFFGRPKDKRHSHYIGQKSEPILRPNFQMNADRSGMDLIGPH